MNIIAASLAVTAAAVTITVLALAVLALAAFRAGTRRQERSGSLAWPAPGRAARLTHRITGLHAEPPPAARSPARAGHDLGTAPARNGARPS